MHLILEKLRILNVSLQLIWCSEQPMFLSLVQLFIIFFSRSCRGFNFFVRLLLPLDAVQSTLNRTLRTTHSAKQTIKTSLCYSNKVAITINREIRGNARSGYSEKTTQWQQQKTTKTTLFTLGADVQLIRRLLSSWKRALYNDPS